AVMFTAAATGDAPLAYQWKKDGAPLADGGRVTGAGTAALTITALTAADAGDYTVTATNASGSATSDAAVLTIDILLSITTQPVPQEWTPGGAATFTVAATGGVPFTYQWKKGGAPLANGGRITGANTATLTITGLVPADLGLYTVTLANAHGSITSAAAALLASLADSARITGIAAGGMRSAGGHSLFVTAGGRLYAMGRNEFGQLGDSLTADRRIPVRITNGYRYIAGRPLELIPLGNVAAVAASAYHSLFLETDGTLYATGNNGSGQFGDGTNTSRRVPMLVATDVTAIAAGINHSLYVKADGRLFAMGNNDSSQLGDGTNTSRSSPVQVATDVTAVAAGGGHSLFLKTDGTLYGMGRNIDGALGTGDTTHRATPVQIATGVAAIAAGDLHSLYVTTDGRLFAMGYNYYGQLGDGTTVNRTTPVLIATSVAAVAAGGDHSLFLKTDGTLHAMGRNDYGQLGLGTGTGSKTPLPVATGVAAIAAGGNHGLYVTTDGKLHAMGRNDYGQLGDGTATNRTAPVPAVTPPIITIRPEAQSKVEGGSVTFTAAAEGTTPLAYRWRKDGASLSNNARISGATSATLAISSLFLGDTGQYSVVVTNTAGSDTSAAALLTVSVAPPPVPPSITTQPVSQTKTAGDSVTFTVTATGDAPLSYQWEKGGSALVDGGRITGATTATLTISTLITDDAGSYTVTVTNSTDNITSAPAALTVNVPPPVPPSITTQPASQTKMAGESVTFTVTATGDAPLSYQWKKGSANLANGERITGATSAMLTISGLTAADAGSYTVTVTNAVNSATSNAATLAVTPSPLTLAQEFKAQIEASGTATITVTGTLDLSLVGGITLTTGKTIVGADAGATLTGGVTVPAGASDIVILGVNFSGGSLGITGAVDVEVTHCTFADTPVSITGGADNITFSWNRFTATLSPAAGSGAAMRIDNAGASTGIVLHHNLWGTGLRADMPAATNARVYMFNNHITATGNTTATIAGASAQILSVNNIYQGVNNPLTKQSGGLLRASGNFMIETAGTTAPGEDKVFVPDYSHLMHPAGVGAPLDAGALANLISGYAGNTAGKNSVTPAATAATARITATATGPGASMSTTGATVPAAGGFTLTASATGFTPTARQWYRDNFAITGATAATHAVSNASAAAHAGAYAVAMTTPAGEIVTTGAFTVTVGDLAPPVITTHPASQIVTAGGSATFSVAATGESLAYQWQKNGTDITGATNASYTITNAQQQTHAGAYRVRVSNAAGSVPSNTATLTVNTGTGGGDSNNNGGGNSGGGGGGAMSLWFVAALFVLPAIRHLRRHLP
ncbi:immunoglobulin domain-containing protein, partial [Termitidicoccus mucosus]